MFGLSWKRRGSTGVLLWFIGAWACLFAKPSTPLGDTTPLVVENHAVSLEEFRWFMQQERAGVFHYVKTKCKIDYNKEFWNRDCDGTTPRALIQKRTIDRIIRDKIQQLLFKELGLIQDIRYSTFLETLEKLNLNREQAAQQGRVLYGPIRYTARQYYGHWMATLQIQAQKKLARERFGVTDEKLRAFYDATKDKAFKATPASTLEIVTIQRVQKPPSHKRSAKIESTARAILSEMRAGDDLDGIMKHYADRSELKVSLERLDQVNDERSNELFPDNNTIRRVKDLVPGESVQITLSESKVIVVRCVSRTPGHYLAYEDNKELVQARYLDQAYEKLVDELVSKAVVHINPEVLDSIFLASEDLRFPEAGDWHQQRPPVNNLNGSKR